MVERIVKAKGTKQCIKHLELLLSDLRSSPTTDAEYTITLSLPVPPSNLPTVRRRHAAGYEQHVFLATPGDSNVPTKGNELVRFLGTVNPASGWTKSRRNAGVTSVERNNWMIRFLVNDPSLRTETSREFLFPAPVRSGNSELEHARSYKQRNKNLKVDKKLIDAISEFGELVFVQWCQVMIKRMTYSVEEVNEMVATWFPVNALKNISRYRYGGDWTSRVSSKLCDTEWGKRAFELFAVHRKSISAYGRFADTMSESTKEANDYLTTPKYAQAIDNEEGWITPCSPCVIKCLADQSHEDDGCYQLRDICSDLCFDKNATRMILKIWDDEYSELYLKLRRARAHGVPTESRPHKRQRVSREDEADCEAGEDTRSNPSPCPAGSTDNDESQTQPNTLTQHRPLGALGAAECSGDNCPDNSQVPFAPEDISLYQDEIQFQKEFYLLLDV